MIHSNPLVALPLVVVLFLVTRPIARKVADREGDQRLYGLLMVAVAAHLAFSGVQLWVVDHIYHGITDYTRYIDQGASLARRYDKFNFSTAGIQPPVAILGQGSVSIAAGVVMAIIGVNKLGLFFVFSWFAFLATLGFFRAFCVTFPEGDRRRYALMVFFLPSLLFWTAGISKETMMYLSLGIAASGASRISGAPSAAEPCSSWPGPSSGSTSGPRSCCCSWPLSRLRDCSGDGVSARLSSGCAASV